MNEEKEKKVRIPREGEVFGRVKRALGASKLIVDCFDNKERLVRISGKMRKRVWIREGDLILVKPWEVQSDERGDAVWRYSRTDERWLRRKGLLK